MFFEIYQDDDGFWRWRLRYLSGHPAAVSERGFEDQNDVWDDIAWVKRAKSVVTFTAEE